MAEVRQAGCLPPLGPQVVVRCGGAGGFACVFCAKGLPPRADRAGRVVSLIPKASAIQELVPRGGSCGSGVDRAPSFSPTREVIPYAFAARRTHDPHPCL